MYAAAARDIPADDPLDDIRYDEWKETIFEHPGLDDDASYVALHGERPVAFAFLVVDREGRRAENEMTGTIAEHRRRGLARLVKMASIEWAARAGATIFTSNDSANRDMLALNEHLGYRPRPPWVQFAKEVGPAG